jgi:hypothetical protein
MRRPELFPPFMISLGGGAKEARALLMGFHV